jgi:hypothetical protein
MLNLLGDNINTIQKNTEVLTDASKEDALEVNTEKTKYMLMSCHYNAWQTKIYLVDHLKMSQKFKYMGITVSN